jgi:hypothetical protein
MEEKNIIKLTNDEIKLIKGGNRVNETVTNLSLTTNDENITNP